MEIFPVISSTLIIYHQMLDVENKNAPLTLALSPAGRGDEKERVPER
ncbi:MAG: hypothetical protein Q8O01_06795 [Candidatus Omnitrophota bacterium]|nr:hypothetical protein [Candidatus Omnitrophota bacterium]